MVSTNLRTPGIILVSGIILVLGFIIVMFFSMGVSISLFFSFFSMGISISLFFSFFSMGVSISRDACGIDERSLNRSSLLIVVFVVGSISSIGDGRAVIVVIVEARSSSQCTSSSGVNGGHGQSW